MATCLAVYHHQWLYKNNTVAAPCHLSGIDFDILSIPPPSLTALVNTLSNFTKTNSMMNFLQKKLLPCLFAITAITAGSSNSYAQPVISFTPFVTGLSSPVDLVNAADGSNRLFIVQRGGTIRIHNGSTLLATPFINLADTILAGGEQGLLSLAFHPDYETNRYFFVWYTDKEGDLTLARYQTSSGNANVADPNSEVVLLEIPKPGTPYFTNHNGGKIIFGNDGYLYVSIGDGGSGGDPFNLSQDGNSLLGKMLRLDVNNFSTPPYYTVPPDNPFISDPSIRDEIWALGLRNPWRWSFDRQTNDMWIADVGQGAREEINFRAAGSTGGVNYGWRCYEGAIAYNTTGCAPVASYVFPVFDYPHNGTTGGFSVTGGHVYRGPDYPLLTGYYIVADFVSGNLWKIRPDGSGGWVTNIQTGLPNNISTFGEAENGRLYAVSLGGTIYVVEANSSLPLKLTDFTAVLKTDAVQLEWKTSYEAALTQFEIEYSTDGQQYKPAGAVAATNNSNGSSYRFNHTISTSQQLYYRIKTIQQSGEPEYSKTIRLNHRGTNEIIITPTVVTNNSITIQSTAPLKMIRLLQTNGKEVYRQAVNERQGIIYLQLPSLKAGIYLLQCQGMSQNQVQKIIVQ